MQYTYKDTFSWQLSKKVILFVNITLLLILALTLCNRIYKITLITPDIGGVESTIIRKVQLLLLDTRLLYTNPETFYFEINQYPPLYFKVMSSLAKLFNIGINDITALYQLNRAFCLLLNISTLLIVFKGCTTVLKSTKSESLLLVTLLFATIPAPLWGRMDSLGLLLFSATAYYALLFGQQKKWNHYWLCLFYLLLATLTKQQYIAYFLPLGLFFKKHWKQSILAFIITIVFHLMILAIYPYYYYNLVNGVNNGFTFSIFLSAIILPFFISNGLLLLLVIAIIAIKKNFTTIISWLFIFSFTISTITATKSGASAAYYMEAMVLALFYVAYIMHQTIKPSKYIWLLLPALLLWNATNQLGVLFQKSTQALSKHYAALLADEQLVYNKVMEQKAPTNGVYTTALNAQSFLMNLFLEKHLFPQKDIILNCALYNQSYPYQAIQKIKDANWPVEWYIKEKSTTTDVFSYKFDNYTLIDSTKYYYIYKK